MNKEYIEAQVVSLTRKIHPQDLGEETSKLENILRQALEDTVAEERERVKGVIENTFTVYFRSIYSQDCSRNETKEDKSTEMIKLSDVIDLLSSLDKPVTDK